MKTLILVALALACASCAGREIRRVEGCDERLELPEKRMECRACVERPLPHAYFADRVEGERCVRI